jgi:copper homeostasis protein
MEFTFHRGFDLCRQPKHQLASLIELGVTRLLSSGQQPLAIDGIALLKELKTVSVGKIEIMPGSGINPKNALAFKTVPKMLWLLKPQDLKAFTLQPLRNPKI